MWETILGIIILVVIFRSIIKEYTKTDAEKTTDKKIDLLKTIYFDK